MAKIEAWKPGVSKSVLLFLAWITWVFAAIALNGIAYSWLKEEETKMALIALAAGFIIALLIHHFGFLRIVDRNLARIMPMEGRRCAFSFIAWKSYILMTAMFAMGYALRQSSIPRFYLAILYIAIGTSLMLSSLRYLRYFFSVTGKKQT